MSLAEIPDPKIPEWTLGDRLRKARESAGLDQQVLADEFGVVVSSISAYEKGRQPGRKLDFVRLVNGYAELTGYDAAWIAGFRTGKKPTEANGLATVTQLRVPRNPSPRGGGGRRMAA